MQPSQRWWQLVGGVWKVGRGHQSLPTSRSVLVGRLARRCLWLCVFAWVIAGMLQFDATRGGIAAHSRPSFGSAEALGLLERRPPVWPLNAPAQGEENDCDGSTTIGSETVAHGTNVFAPAAVGIVVTINVLTAVNLCHVPWSEEPQVIDTLSAVGIFAAIGVLAAISMLGGAIVLAIILDVNIDTLASGAVISSVAPAFTDTLAATTTAASALSLGIEWSSPAWTAIAFVALASAAAIAITSYCITLAAALAAISDSDSAACHQLRQSCPCCHLSSRLQIDRWQVGQTIQSYDPATAVILTTTNVPDQPVQPTLPENLPHSRSRATQLLSLEPDFVALSDSICMLCAPDGHDTSDMNGNPEPDMILAYTRSQGLIALAVASTGIAALLLPGGTTLHSRFKVPLNADQDSMLNILAQSPDAELIRRTTLLVWDEAVMNNKHILHAMDRTLRLLRSDDALLSPIFPVVPLITGVPTVPTECELDLHYILSIAGIDHVPPLMDTLGFAFPRECFFPCGGFDCLELVVSHLTPSSLQPFAETCRLACFVLKCSFQPTAIAHQAFCRWISIKVLGHDAAVRIQCMFRCWRLHVAIKRRRCKRYLSLEASRYLYKYIWKGQHGFPNVYCTFSDLDTFEDVPDVD